MSFIPIYLKRLYKEIQNFNEQKNFHKYNSNIQCFFNNLILSEYITNDKDNNTFLDFIDNNNKKLLLTLKVPNKYPFQSYEIFYNNISYNLNKKNTYLKNLILLNKNRIFDEKILNFFFKLQYNLDMKLITLKKNDCYCCSSYACHYNWCPSLTFENILLEYLEVKFIAKYSKPYNYLYILNIYNNLFDTYIDKLPLELQCMIFEKLS